MGWIAVAAVLALSSVSWGQGVKGGAKVVQGFDGPSFDCSRAVSGARKMVCDTPELAAMDMRNHQHYIALLQRGRMDGSLTDLQNEQFLAGRDRCASVACIRSAYQVRDKALDVLEVTMNAPAGGPEAAFTATDAAWAKARALLGKPCGEAPATPFRGFTRIPGFRTLVLAQSWVGGFTTPGGRFAFLLTYQGDDYANCRVKDVIAVPAVGIVYPALECNLDSDDSHGLGLVRAGGKGRLYWRVNAGANALERVPQAEIAKSRLRCSEPESGF